MYVFFVVVCLCVCMCMCLVYEAFLTNNLELDMLSEDMFRKISSHFCFQMEKTHFKKPNIILCVFVCTCILPRAGMWRPEGTFGRGSCCYIHEASWYVRFQDSPASTPTIGMLGLQRGATICLPVDSGDSELGSLHFVSQQWNLGIATELCFQHNLLFRRYKGKNIYKMAIKNFPSRVVLEWKWKLPWKPHL